MESNKIENIIVKYLNHQASFSELEELDEWIKDPENDELFKSYVRTNYAIDYNLKKFSSTARRSIHISSCHFVLQI